MARVGRSQQFFSCQPKILLLALHLQVVLGGDSASDGTSSPEEPPKSRLQKSKGTAMMQTGTMLQMPVLAGAHHRPSAGKPQSPSKQRLMNKEERLNIDVPSPRIPDPFFGLQDAFDEENTVEVAAIRAASAPVVSAEWLSVLWALCVDALMGGAGAATFLYLRAHLFGRAKLDVQARKNKQPKLVDEDKAAASASAASASAASASAAPELLRPDGCDDWGCSPLHLLAAAGDKESIKELLQQQHVEVNAREAWEETPLHLAARAGHVEVCKLLLGHGADINAMGLGGETPLVVAAKDGKEAVCQLLLLHGAGCGGLRDDELPDLLVKMIIARMLPQED